MLKIPDNLIKYVDFEEGKIIAVNLPESLEDDFQKFKEEIKKEMNEELADY